VAISVKRRSGNGLRLLLTRVSRLFAIPLIFVAFRQSTCAAQTYLWDPDQTGTGSDDSGNWDTTSAIWSTGSTDTTWPNTTNSTNVASFGSNNGTAGTVTLQTPIWSDGLTFNAAGSGDYTIAAAAAVDTLTLGGPITVAPGLDPTIGAIIPSGSLQLSGGGSLTVAGANTYSGNTSISNGTMNVAAGGSLGNPNSSILNLGSLGLASASNLNLLTSVTVFRLGSANAPTTNTININPGQTLTIGGLLNVGFGQSPGAWTSQLNFTGGGNLAMNVFASVSIGSNSAPTGNNVICDLSGLNKFSFFSEQGISVGLGGTATLTLAKTNSLTLGNLQIGPNNSFSNFGLDTVNLGSISNTFNMSGSIVIGGNNSDGTVGWLSTTTTGSLSISGMSPAARSAGIVVGQGSSLTNTPGTASLLLDGHSVNILIQELDIGQAQVSGNIVGSVEFDTGTFDTTTINMSQRAGGTVISTLTLGSSPASTGVLIVNISSGSINPFFSLVDNTAAATSATCSGTFDIKGGTAEINCPITVNAHTGNTTPVAGGSGTVILEGGTLNMMGFSIGGAAAINNVTLIATGGTLENVFSINGSGGGVNMTGTGSLTIAGANSWTGPTSVSSGTMIFAAGSTLGATAISVASGAVLNMMAGSVAGNSHSPTGGATLAGATGGATFSLEDSAIGTFTLRQNSFSGIALTLGGDTLDFDISNLGTDEILDSGPGKASISGVNIINIDALTQALTPGVYTLISIPSGGLTGTFKFANLQTSEVLDGYTLSLTNSSTAETLTVVPEPIGTGFLSIGALTILSRRRLQGPTKR
jgi:fibronectin-binding autotransporter adhesin